MSDIKKKLLSKKTGKAEIIALLIYIAGVILIMCFHEPWFDEAEAWQIARCAPLKKILFEVPHYECHPQLWHLILAVFAKSGAPYELSIKAINLVFITAGMSVLLFKSPFPKIIRCLLPFNYFFFYQYGVISRPYSILVLSLMLAAAGYKERNSHPWKYILPLCLLCLSSALGIILAGGLCIVWTMEILTELFKEKKFGTVFKDKRVYALALILVLALVLIVSIIPAENCFSPNGVHKYLGYKENYLSDLIVAIILPLESWSGTAMGTSGTTDLTLKIELPVCIAVWILLIAFARKNKKALTFLVPYLFLSSYFVFSYIAPHHLGVSTTFLVFSLWIMSDKEEGLLIPEPLKKLPQKFTSAFSRKAVSIGCILFFSAPVLYSAVSSFNEIRLPYSEAPLADFIKENDLDKTRIMSAWHIWKAPKTSYSLVEDKYLFSFMEQPSKHSEVLMHETYDNYTTTLLPYFDDNFIMNFNVDFPGENYVHHIFKEDVEKVFSSWAEQGLPEVLIDYCYLDEIYDEETLEGVRYLPVFEQKKYSMFKTGTDEVITRVYIREDLLDNYPQLKWIYDPENPSYEQ